MLADFFNLTTLFWITALIAFFKLMQVSSYNTEIETFLKYDNDINVSTKPGELSKTLTAFYKKLKSTMESYKKDDTDKRYIIYKEIKATIELYQEETYAYRKSEIMEEAPTGENVLEVAKIEFKIKSQLALLKKLLKSNNDINTLWLIIILFALFGFFIKFN
jgi:hypothetical protein